MDLTIKTKGKLKVITTTMSLEDYEYMKKHQLKFSDALREKVAQHSGMNSEDYKKALENALAGRERVVEQRERILEFLRNIEGKPFKFDDFLAAI